MSPTPEAATSVNSRIVGAHVEDRHPWLENGSEKG
jgi:hypothetical protein